MTDALHRLLELQDLDLAADQLRHRRANLAERARLAAASAAVAGHEASLAELSAAQVAHLERQRAVEDELETLAERAQAEERRLYGGGVTQLREVEAIRSELETIVRRRDELEDEALTEMELVDETSRSLDQEQRDLSIREREVVQLIGEIGSLESTIDEELATNVAARSVLSEEIGDELLNSYERLRARLGGVAVARLEGGHCLGCHLALPATEVDAVRKAPEGALVTHEECGRILVR